MSPPMYVAHSTSKYSLNACCVPPKDLQVGETTVKKLAKVPVLVELIQGDRKHCAPSKGHAKFGSGAGDTA